MKIILVVFGFALLSLSALAQDAQEPTPPSYCKPCLFYGGDFDPGNPSSGELANENTLEFGDRAVYVPFKVPVGQTWTVIGLFSNNFAAVPHLYPPKIQWSISAQIVAGHNGKLIASGTTTASLTPTGRSFNGLGEYTALGYLSPSTTVTLTPGVYWMTAVPVCTENIPGTCQGAEFAMSSVEDVNPPNHVGFEPNDHSYWLWLGGGEYFIPTGGAAGVCGGGCDRFSAGLLGTATPDN